MPANLPPEYFAIEKEYRKASTAQEKIYFLQRMLAVMPHHKGTDKLQAELRAKIAKLNKEMQKKKITKGFSYHIRKEGEGQIVMIGPPNVGKSSLLATLTNSKPAIKEYPFTTTTPQVGMLEIKGVKFQLVEVPALGYNGGERWLNPLAQTGDVLMFIVSVDGEVEEVMKKMKVFGDKKQLVVINKIDIDEKKANSMVNSFPQNISVIKVSSLKLIGLEELKEKIYETLGIVRIYTKEPGKKPEFSNPIVLPRGSTLKDAAKEVHKDFANFLKYARVWGGGKFKGQRVGKDYILEDGDVVEFHI